MKKVVIPIITLSIFIIYIISTCTGNNKIKLEWERIQSTPQENDTIELKVYVENSGSMDAYMCSGSNLKDAVFDYVSDLKKHSSTCSLFYINSKLIPYNGELQSFIKDLTPYAFSKAGGNRANTDLREIFEMILSEHNVNTVTVFVSDCILDLPENATDFFGNCQISIKNTFNEALSKNPYLGVEIIKLSSKFNGYWYCGNNSEKLSDVKRPYYIWIIGNNHTLAKLNKKVSVNNIIGNIDSYCAYSVSQPISFDIEKNIYTVNHTNKINIQLLVNLEESLQSESIIQNTNQYKSSNPSQTTIVSIEKITDESSRFSHVIELQIDNPQTVKSETITFSYPYLPSWVAQSNDDTGKDIRNNIYKTTGILYLIKGVAEAYKAYTDYGTIEFNLKNK